MRATFVLSNAVPQRGSVNSGAWARVEAAVRRLAAVSDLIYVFTGPVFDSDEPAVIGTGRVAVPDATFKAVLAVTAGQKTMFAAIVPNADGIAGAVEEFATSIDEVERRTGLDFFAELADAEEGLLEAEVRTPLR
jgi:endonuclease G